jgi:biotin carboxylase
MTDHSLQDSVLLLEPESSGVGLLAAAGRLGFAAHIFDRRALNELPKPVAEAVAQGRARYTRVELRDLGTALDAAVRLAAEASLIAVVPGFEYSVETAAHLAAKLGLRGLDPATVGALRDKLRMQRTLGPLGTSTGVLVDPADDGTGASAGLRFPAVVKPVDGCGSLMVRRVESAEQLRAELAVIRRAPVDDMGKQVGAEVLVEPYIDGPEFSVEGNVADGRVTVAAVTEKWLSPEPHFVELGHAVEARLDAAERALLADTAVKAVEALGVNVGAFHAEVRLSTRGPVVIEVAARLGGDLIPDLVARVHGRDLYEATVRAFAGLPIPELESEQEHDTPVPLRARVAAVRFFAVDREIRMLADPQRITAEIARIPGCEQVALHAVTGQILRPATDFRQRFGHALITADDRDELDARVAAVDRVIARMGDSA